MQLRRALVLVCTFLALAASTARAEDTPQEIQFWTYAQVVAALHPNWALAVMPGVRLEAWDSAGDAGGLTMVELFAGPLFTRSWGAFSLAVPLWYYYMGFPIREKDEYWDSHNLELIPTLGYRTGAWTLTSRTILHNKLYARNTKFETTELRRGYSLLVRQMFQVSYAVLPKLAIVLADELFLGVVEDQDTKDIAKGEPFFEQTGFSMNRVYAGVQVPLAKGMAISPQYVLETQHDPDDGARLKKIRHYLFVTFGYSFSVF